MPVPKWGLRLLNVSLRPHVADGTLRSTDGDRKRRTSIELSRRPHLPTAAQFNHSALRQ